MRPDFTGGKGGGGSTFKTRPDTLRSNDTFEGVIGLCAGPIKGPVNGLKSLKIDTTPIEDATGKMNFPGFVVLTANGDPTLWPQKVDLKLGGGAAPVQVGLPITNPNPAAPGEWVTKTLPNINADYIDLRFIVNALFFQDDKGIRGADAHLEIEMKPSGSLTWINPLAAGGVSGSTDPVISGTPTSSTSGEPVTLYEGGGGGRLYHERVQLN